MNGVHIHERLPFVNRNKKKLQQIVGMLLPKSTETRGVFFFFFSSLNSYKNIDSVGKVVLSLIILTVSKGVFLCFISTHNHVTYTICDCKEGIVLNSAV